MREGTYVEKIRKWHEPKTEITVTKDSIGSRMAMEDFVKALKIEMGSITTIVRTDTFHKKLDDAIAKIMEQI